MCTHPPPPPPAPPSTARLWNNLLPDICTMDNSEQGFSTPLYITTSQSHASPFIINLHFIHYVSKWYMPISQLHTFTKKNLNFIWTETFFVVFFFVFVFCCCFFFVVFLAGVVGVYGRCPRKNNTWPPTSRTLVTKNPIFDLVQSIACLVTRTGIKSRMSSNSSQIGLLTLELLALQCQTKPYSTLSRA